MQNTSDDNHDSDDITDTEIPSDDDSSTSSDNNMHQDSDCICGGDNSDSDWTDESIVESKRAKFEVDKNLSLHQQLHRAIRLHDCRVIRQLLEDGAQPCTRSKNSRNCFILARRSRFILQKLLEIEPMGVNCQDSEGSTLLMLNENENIFRLLCRYRPDVNLLNDYGDNFLLNALKEFTPLFASELKHILDLGLDVNFKDATGETALTLAIKAGKNLDFIAMLLERGATLPPPDVDGKTVIMYLIEADNKILTDKVEVLKALFRHGADASAKDKDGHNAMYYAISECFSNLRCLTNVIQRLEEIIIMLLKRGCEVQGLDRCYIEYHVINNSCDRIIRRVPLTYDVISAIVNSNLSIALLKELLKRGLYIPNPQVLSPLSACLLHTLMHTPPETGLRALGLAKELILLGTNVSQRIWHEISCPSRTEPLEYNHRTRAEYQAAVASELDIPDALFFAANMSIAFYDFLEEPGEICIRNIHLAVEEVFRLLLRFWPHPPLLLMLLRVDPVWCPLLITKHISNGDTSIFYIMKVLAKIGGPLPLGTRYYTILKSALQRMAERNDEFQVMLNMLVTDREIPTLRNLSHAAFRATVKKTCPTGLDFSEYRVLCQGEMAPLPPDIVSFLEFRD